MAIFTTSKNEILALDNPGFYVDVVARNKGTIQASWARLDWDEAVERALSAIEDGLQVEIEEHWQN